MAWLQHISKLFHCRLRCRQVPEDCCGPRKHFQKGGTASASTVTQRWNENTCDEMPMKWLRVDTNRRKLALNFRSNHFLMFSFSRYWYKFGCTRTYPTQTRQQEALHWKISPFFGLWNDHRQRCLLYRIFHACRDRPLQFRRSRNAAVARYVWNFNVRM